jgi:hypothetical protein
LICSGSVVMARISHARGFEEFNRKRADHEGKARGLGGGLLEQRAVIGADEP